MPKIIANLREELMQEAKRQIIDLGYENTTIRSVASACRVAVGTVYNYFPSKDMLIAESILRDWLECLDAINNHPKENRRAYLGFIHESLIKFEEKYKKMFSSNQAKSQFGNVFFERHRQLRHQLAKLVLPVCDTEFTAEYVAEALLTWTMSGISCGDIYELLPEKIK